MKSSGTVQIQQGADACSEDQLDSLHHVVWWSQESIDISRGCVNLP